MFHRWLALVLLVLQLQPALALMPDQVGALAAEIEHQAVHRASQDHHHGESLSAEPDDSGASAWHVHHDDGHHSALLPPMAGLSLQANAPVDRARFLAGNLPHPHLEGPLRPPRFSA